MKEIVCYCSSCFKPIKDPSSMICTDEITGRPGRYCKDCYNYFRPINELSKIDRYRLLIDERGPQNRRRLFM